MKNRNEVLLQQFVQSTEKRAKSREEMRQIIFDKENVTMTKDALFQPLKVNVHYNQKSSK